MRAGGWSAVASLVHHLRSGSGVPVQWRALGDRDEPIREGDAGPTSASPEVQKDYFLVPTYNIASGLFF
eukprot:3241382-Pyramimonas_sp.AAC.1